MSNKVFIVDAFTSEKFKGNQAAVCLISQELSTEIYQKIAAEFNLSETVFPLPLEDKTWKTAKHFSLRWFTPTVEIDLCGHATLATAHVLFNEIGNSNKELIFSTLSGDLVVKNENGKLFMDFPCFKNLTNYSFENLKGVKSAKFVEKVVKHLTTNLNVDFVGIDENRQKMLIVLDPETTKTEFESIQADKTILLEAHDGTVFNGVIVTLAPNNAIEQGFHDANGKTYDYVSRYFAPWQGVLEDPATGSAQCFLGPYWSEQKKHHGPFYAFQNFPKRGAHFYISTTSNGRVQIGGDVVTIIRGEIVI